MARAERRAWKGRSAWRDRLIAGLEWWGLLFALMDEIPRLIDNNISAGLKEKCVIAPELWREQQAVLREGAQDERARGKRRRMTTAEREMAEAERDFTLILEAGAAGDGPDEIRAKLAATLSCNGTVE
jgi:hypothetical protein